MENMGKTTNSDSIKGLWSEIRNRDILNMNSNVSHYTTILPSCGFCPCVMYRLLLDF